MSHTEPVRKAVFPVGGLGTRFLPATKAMPKEMLPVVDKPLIQYAVEEAAAAGIEEFIFVTGRNKSAIEDHFDRAVELHNTLIAREKYDAIEVIQNVLFKPGCVAFTRQQEPLGLGHAVWCARHFIGEDEPFAVLLADELMLAERPCMTQLFQVFAENVRGNLLSVMEVPAEDTARYGILDLAEEDRCGRFLSSGFGLGAIGTGMGATMMGVGARPGCLGEGLSSGKAGLSTSPSTHSSHVAYAAHHASGFSAGGGGLGASNHSHIKIFEARGIVEKPLANPPSRMAAVGRYLLDGRVFSYLADIIKQMDKKEYRGPRPEIQLTDALHAMHQDGIPLYGVEFQGQRFDCGTKEGLLEASLTCALQRPDMMDQARRIVEKVLNRGRTMN